MISDIARQVLDIIPNHRRWIQHNEVDLRSGRRCVIGALNSISAYGQERTKFARLFSAIAAEQFPDMTRAWLGDFFPSYEGDDWIASVNDADDMHYKGIRVILEKIAARED